MSRDVERLVRQAATGPTRELDTGEVVARAWRQTMWLRAGVGVAGVAVVAVAALLALPVGGTAPGVEVTDEPVASEDGGQTGTAEDLEGRTFVSSEIVESGSPRELVEDTTLTVTFDPSSFRQLEGENPDEGVDHDSWLRWDAGCNHHESAVLLEGDTLEFVGRNMVTSMRCPDDKEEQNRWLRDFFDSDPTWKLDGRQLTLASDDTLIMLEEAGSAEAAEEAGSHQDAWPVELIYTRGDGEQPLRFRGNSWADWSLEAIDPATDETRLVDRQYPGTDFEPEAGAFLDEPHEPTDERGTGPELLAGWREAVGLGERTVVPVGEIPGGPELVSALGLHPRDVEAYVTPDIEGCLDDLEVCAGGSDAARGIAHRETGFPLFAEELYDGNLEAWLTAQSFTHGDPWVAPIPLEDIPSEGNS
jgi:hypothetical protein